MLRRTVNLMADGPRRPTGNYSVRDVVLVLAVVLAGSEAARAGDPSVAMRERYLGPAGLPAESAYAVAQGLAAAPGSESFAWQATFKLTYRTADLPRLEDAQPVHTDCYFTRTRKFTAPFRAQPVWDGRVYQEEDRLVVAAYTSKRERVLGSIDEATGEVRVEAVDKSIAWPDFNGVQYNPFTGQLWRRVAGGAIEESQRFYLPAPLLNARGEQVRPEFAVVPLRPKEFALVARSGDSQVTLATFVFDAGKDAKSAPGFSPGLIPGCSMATDEPTTVFEAPGVIAADVLDVRGAELVLRSDLPAPADAAPVVKVDGQFDEWRSVQGIADPTGDIVSYLQYNPDTDLVEFKVASDDEYLYFYTRVVGRHGNSAVGRDRYYFYVYIDADRDAKTGYLPTRDDDCYYGVALGDDFEVQYEFVGGSFLKTFFGIAGRTTEKSVLAGHMQLAPSWYAKYDDDQRLRDRYKVEYIRRAGKLSITEDFTAGTSEDIVVALSPDGSECEIRAAISGFLPDENGKPIIAAGKCIDLAAGVEASGQVWGHSKWGADSTAVVRGYRIAK